MQNTIENIYEYCNECKFAEFVTYDRMICLKSIRHNPYIECTSYQQLQFDDNNNVSEKREHVIELVENKSEKQISKDNLIIIENTNDKRPSTLDNRIYTLKETEIYDCPQLLYKKKTIASGKFIAYKREIVRNGKNLLLIDNSGIDLYIEKDLSKIQLCDQCVVKKNIHMDFILISHQAFDNYSNSLNPDVIRIDSKIAENTDSFIEIENNNTIVTIKDKYVDDNRTVFCTNSIQFNSNVLDIKIGRLSSSSKFYMMRSENLKNASKIITLDGREGILISSPEMFDTIEPLLQKIIYFICGILPITIITIVTIYSKTGRIVFNGIVFIILLYIVFFAVAKPLYFILNYIKKRL